LKSALRNLTASSPSGRRISVIRWCIEHKRPQSGKSAD